MTFQSRAIRKNDIRHSTGTVMANEGEGPEAAGAGEAAPEEIL